MATPSKRRRWAAALVILAALIAALVFALREHRPNIARNYAAELNAPILAVPEADRAWPLYRDAIIGLDPEHPARHAAGWSPATAGEDWDRVARFVAEFGQSLELARRASRMPALGLPLTDAQDPELARGMAERWGYPYTPERPSENPPMFTLLIPHLGGLGQLARGLRAEAHLALAGDPDLAARNLRAIVRIAEHGREHPLAINEIWSIRTLELAVDAVLEMLADGSAAALTDEHLRGIAEDLAGFAGGGPIVPRLEGENMGFMDMIQRMYSDDGRGGGRMTADGVRMLQEMKEGLAPGDGWSRRPRVVDRMAAWGHPPRRQVEQAWEQRITSMEALFARPLWQWDNARVSRATGGEPGEGLLGLMPSLYSVGIRAQHASQRRNAALVAIALELYKREHGAYPESLDALIPAFLDEIPRDVFDGGPLKYRLAEAGPVLYSVGGNRRDNGGAAPETGDPTRWYSPTALEMYENSPLASEIPEGDWVLYPPTPDTRR